MYSHWRHSNWVVLAAPVALLVAACGQQRDGEATVVEPGRLERPLAFESELQPGVPVALVQVRNPYVGDAAAVGEGRRLYHWYNCSGCHFNGGGGIGPALLDDEWIYGGEAQNLYDSITRGRPNGMPAFGGRIPEKQVWQIAAFVQSLRDEQTVESGAPPEERQSDEDREMERGETSRRPDGGRSP
jgi:cytochrome c oxidase cbb3-type subunit III